MSEQPLVTYYQTLSSPLVENLNNIKLVVFDVDGTLSDGGIFIGKGASLGRRERRAGALGICPARRRGRDRDKH